MDVISTQVNNNLPKKRWFKKPLFYIIAIVLIVIFYFLIRLGIIYSTIVVENGSFFENVSKVLFGGKNNTDNQPDDNILYPMPSPETDRLDVLILGIRGTSQEAIEVEGGLLTDTIQVVSVDRKTSKASIISIPRDLYITVSGLNGKINEAYERGLAKNQGLEFAKTIISKITGVYIDKAIVFDFDAFQKIIDAIGGIDIVLAKPFVEPSQWGYEFNLPAGKNHLNGEQALYYVRSRYSSSDFDRARRQQEVMSAIKVKASEEGYLSNPLKITSLLSEVKNDIKTDFQIWDINDLLNVAGRFKANSQVKEYVIDSGNLLYESKGPKNEFILLPKGDNFDGIKNIFKEILVQK